MMFYYADGYEEDEDYNKEGRFYNHWNMPVLRRLRTTEIAPVAAFGSTLTSQRSGGARWHALLVSRISVLHSDTVVPARGSSLDGWPLQETG